MREYIKTEPEMHPAIRRGWNPPTQKEMESIRYAAAEDGRGNYLELIVGRSYSNVKDKIVEIFSDPLWGPTAVRVFLESGRVQIFTRVIEIELMDTQTIGLASVGGVENKEQA